MKDSTVMSSARGLLTLLLSALLVISYAGSAGAVPAEVSITNVGVDTAYNASTAMGTATYTVEVRNATSAAAAISPTITPTLPSGAKVSGVTATAKTSSGVEHTPKPGATSGSSYVIDEASVPAGVTYTYAVTVSFGYSGTPTALTCAKDGGLKTTASLAGSQAPSADACLDAPTPPSNSSSAPAPSKQSAPAPSTDTPSAEAKSAPGPQAAPAPQAAPTPNQDPVGTFGSWVNSDGLIYFSGWAYDPSDMSKAPTTMWTIDGKVVAYQVATLASPDLYPYGVYNRGVFGGLYAPNPGKHQLCMFVFNIGAGADKLTKCLDVVVPNADPTGDLGATVLGNGDIVATGYAYDPSNVYAQPVIWVSDNGTVVGSLYANAPGPNLAPYGVPGNHGFNYRWGPTTTGTHQICLYVQNIGWGNSTWPKCVTVSIAPDAARDNPRGDFAVYSNQGSIGVSGWAYDPNQYGTSVNTMWTVDGNAVGFGTANQPHAGVNNYLGVGGNHGITLGLPASVGWHTVCQYVINVGLGSTVVTKCVNVQVVAPPNPCPAYAKACVDLTNNTTWLQVNGQIVYGPVKQIAGRAGYRTPTGSYKVYWKHIDHKSSIFNNAPMPYSIFFNGGIAFHVGALNVPSHGCIHLSWEAAKVYWDNLQVGDTVYVFGAAQY